MTDKPEKTEKSAWTGKAALAGAAIGSAALAAALLYASSRRKPKDGAAALPAPKVAPDSDAETD